MKNISIHSFKTYYYYNYLNDYVPVTPAYSNALEIVSMFYLLSPKLSRGHKDIYNKRKLK